MNRWSDKAACRGSYLDWFPSRGQDSSRQKAVCRTCPVVAECLEDALMTGTYDGIRGGLTPSERRPLHSGYGVCVHCGKHFRRQTHAAKVCSEACRAEAREIAVERWNRARRENPILRSPDEIDESA